MPRQPRILVFAGSARRGSLNKSLARAAAEIAGKAGAEVTFLDLADYELPLYNGGLEEASGLPENATKLKKIFVEHDGLLIVCPEYNSSITPLLKNTIDWLSRPVEGEAPFAQFEGKVVLLLSASPGALGGLRGLVHVRAILGNIRCLVLPQQRAFSKADEMFDDDGRLKNERDRESLAELTGALVKTTRRQMSD